MIVGTDYMVCYDCYYAHHYGVTEITRQPTDFELQARQHPTNTWWQRANSHLVWNDDGTVTEWQHENGEPCDTGQPLTNIPDGAHITDNTCSNHDWDAPCECGNDTDGIVDFGTSRCDGCHNPLAGHRFRLHIWSTQ